MLTGSDLLISYGKAPPELFNRDFYTVFVVLNKIIKSKKSFVILTTVR